MKVILILLVFLIISALVIISNNHLQLCNAKNIEKFEESYVEWFNELYMNSQILTGEIIGMNWLPGR